jgi:hypothetical protein
MVNVMTMKSWLDGMLGDINYAPDSKAGGLYPFFVRVACIKRRPPRHDFFEFFLDVGVGMLDAVMEHNPIKQSDLVFVFPERWLGVAEQQVFTYMIEKHPDVKNIKSVDIITSSPMLIGSFMREQIRIVTWPEDTGLFDGAAGPAT